MAPSHGKSSGADSVDPNDINAFLQNHRATAEKRTGRLPNHSDWATPASAVPRSARTHITAPSATRRHAQSSMAHTARRSSSDPSTVSSDQSSYMLSTAGSSVFDTTGSTSSNSTALNPSSAYDSIYGDELQSVYEDEYEDEPESTDEEDEPELIYPCEFEEYTGCDERHALGEEQLWFEHIAISHMGRKYPKRSSCWYCDRIFEPTPGGTDGRGEAFERRMAHIAKHIREGTHKERRPDHDLIKHLAKYRLVPDHVLNAAKTFHEATQPKDVEFVPHSPYARGMTRPSVPSRRRPSGPLEYSVGRRGVGEGTRRY